KMAQRLFLDGIDLQRGGRAVAQAVEFSVAIHADEAEAGLSGMDVAVARAKVAVNFPAGFGFPPPRFVECFRLLEDLQFSHRTSFVSVYISEKARPYLWQRGGRVHPATQPASMM